ncbi:MAG: GTP-binding protein [Oscillospiraceae bacterium]|nr:GTP-binding protein [Oscillospiraceae bacterium]
MDDRLKRVVQSGARISICVNLDLLEELTVRHTYSNMEALDWKKVQRLHILGTKNDWKQGNNSSIGNLKRGCYVDATGKWVLLAGANGGNLQGYLSRCSPDLECLFIGYTELPYLDIQAFRNLKELYLIGNKRLDKVMGLESCSNLTVLDLYRANIDFVLDLTPFSALEKLNLGFSEIKGVRLSEPLKQLRVCNLTHAKIKDMGFLRYCLQLEDLRLSRNPIRKIPEAIRRMEHLRALTLTKLSLEELPYWLPELRLSIGQGYGYGINLQDTTISTDHVIRDLSFLNGSQESIRSRFEEFRKAKTGTPLNEIKVVFLGDGSTGKSLTIARLMQENIGAMPKDFDGEATPGIAIKDRPFLLEDGRKIQVHFWDFGGQEILHSMHRIFLTDRTLYVVMINARNDTQDAQARYWLHNVNSFAPGCPVLLVLNQVDQNPNASVDERGLQSKNSNLKKIIRLSALKDSRDTFNNAFTRPLLKEIASFKGLSEMVPHAKKAVLEQIRDMKEDYIRGSQFIKICKDEGIKDSEEQLKLMGWFNEIGISFFCGGTPRLQDYVVLKPEWITTAIYTIIWNKQADTVNGMVDQNDIYRLLVPGDDSSVKMVRRDMSYEPQDVRFILDIARKFRLSFAIDDDNEFIPMLCRRNSLPLAEEFPKRAQITEFRFEYEYLPDNVLHRLMVDMHRDLKRDEVWFTGAAFEHVHNNTRALVKSEDNTLSIYIQATDDAHRAHTYLNTFRSALDAIHNDMGLKPPEMQAAYRKDGKSEYFDYDMLEGTRNHGGEAVYSKVFRQMIPIKDILNGTDIRVVEKNKKLLRDLAQICMQLQCNRNLHEKPDGTSVSEDDRNDMLRDALRNKGYHVSDQTHVGTGKTGKRAGSLDLQIQYEDNFVWTNLEAMNLANATESQRKYWNDHLDRLLKEYNQTGLPTLFLISYVNCPPAKYSEYYYKYKEHMGVYSPENATVRHDTLSDVLIDGEQYAYLRICKCNYDQEGTPVTVYHYFVGFTGDYGRC